MIVEGATVDRDRYDTVMYSVTAEKWPEVRARLEQRLGYVP